MCESYCHTREFELFPSFDPQGDTLFSQLTMMLLAAAALTMDDATLLVIPSKLDGWLDGLKSPPLCIIVPISTF